MCGAYTLEELVERQLVHLGLRYQRLWPNCWLSKAVHEHDLHGPQDSYVISYSFPIVSKSGQRFRRKVRTCRFRWLFASTSIARSSAGAAKADTARLIRLCAVPV